MEITSADRALFAYETKFLGRHVPRQMNNPLWNRIAERLGDISSVYVGRPDERGYYTLGVKTRASFASYRSWYQISAMLDGPEARMAWVDMFGGMARQTHKAVYRVAKLRERRGIDPAF